jgi:hypothetical protein
MDTIVTDLLVEQIENGNARTVAEDVLAMDTAGMALAICALCARLDDKDRARFIAAIKVAVASRR